MSDCLIVGGGVVGLSLAYELAGHGARVRVLEAGQVGQQASWAGAGILPPACATADDPLERLTALSNRLHRQWSQELRETTRIDNGYQRTGAIYLARSAADARELEQLSGAARVRKIEVRRLDEQERLELEPNLQPSGTLQSAYLVNDECQLRNPRHLKALAVACAARGVEIREATAVEDFEIRAHRVRAVRTAAGSFEADTVCVTTGCWTGNLGQKLGLSLAIAPVRGQMVLLALPQPPVSRIINEGSRYLVPRADGRLLVGSTEEDAGFDRRTTSGAIAGLLELAISLVPDLAAAPVERWWAGLRPSTRDGRPYLGRVPEIDNAFVAAGHFRSGLQQSTGTAVVMSQLIRGQEPEIDLSSFRLDRDHRRSHQAVAT